MSVSWPDELGVVEHGCVCSSPQLALVRLLASDKPFKGSMAHPPHLAELLRAVDEHMTFTAIHAAMPAHGWGELFSDVLRAQRDGLVRWEHFDAWVVEPAGRALLGQLAEPEQVPLIDG